MKKLIQLLILLLLCIFPKIQAQQAAIASGGKAIGTGGSSSYTIGQLHYIKMTGSNGNVSQGIQSFKTVVLGSIDYPEITLQAILYPNPTTSLAYLKIDNHSLANLEYQLYNPNGEPISNKKITLSETTIPLENFLNAIYLLQILDNGKLIKTFKIIKN